MTFALLGTARTTGTDSASTRTTEEAVGFRNTTGAKLIVAVFSGNLGATTTLTDTVGNTYQMVNLAAGTENRIRLYYCIDPITSASHNWQISGTSMFGVLHVAYFSNTSSVVGVDVSNSASGSGSTRATGSVTPGYSESLLIAAAVTGVGGSSFSIGGGFTIGANNSTIGVDSVNFGGAIAYLIQTAIAAANPTWTMPVSSNHAAGIIVFRGGDGVAGGGDTTAPVLSSPSGTGGLGVCSGSVSTDEGNGTLYAVATASAAQPSVAQIKAGQDHTGAAALRAVSQAVSATGTQTIASGAISGGAGTRYWHFLHTDTAGNDSNRVSSAGFSVTAPATTMTIALKQSDGTTAAASITGIEYAILNAATLGAATAILDTGTGESTDASGNLVLDITGLGLTPGQARYVIAGKSNGTVGADFDGWHGPATAA